MAVKFYYGSGSPYAWRVWLVLEHKRLAYEFKLISFSAGDLHKPEFIRLNPRHRVPVIVDGDFVLYESVAIMEYLEDRYPHAPRLFPEDVRQRATVRRLLMEIDWYLGQGVEKLVGEVLFKPRQQRNADYIEEAKAACAKELEYFEETLQHQYLAGEFTAADIALYPLLALLQRLDLRQKELSIAPLFGPKLIAWMRRIESLPYFDKTYPPHWRDATK